MEPSSQFQDAMLALLKAEFPRPVYDNIPENADLPYVAWLDDSWRDDSAKDVRGWLGSFSFEAFDLDEYGRTRIKPLLSVLDDLLHDLQGATALPMVNYRLDWIAYQSSATARSGDNTRFRGTITFVCRVESLEESTT